MTRIDSRTVESLRTPGVVAVLDAVRRTGMSAHDTGADGMSTLVFAVAVYHGLNPVELQRQVEEYADAMDALSFPVGR